jgi:hypothetical protein
MLTVLAWPTPLLSLNLVSNRRSTCEFADMVAALADADADADDEDDDNDDDGEDDLLSAASSSSDRGRIA